MKHLNCRGEIFSFLMLLGTYEKLKIWETRAYIEIKDHKFEKRIIAEEINSILSFMNGKL